MKLRRKKEVMTDRESSSVPSTVDDARVKIEVEEITAENQQAEPPDVVHSHFVDVDKVEYETKTEISSKWSQSQEQLSLVKCDPDLEMECEESFPSSGTQSQINTTGVKNEQVISENKDDYEETSLEEGSDGDFCVEIDVDESTQHFSERQVSAKEMEDYCSTSTESIVDNQKTSDNEYSSVEDRKSHGGNDSSKHSGEKRYKCPFCAKSFSLKTNLTTHVKIHDGEKPFECPTCGKLFAKKCYLTSHVRIHTGEKPFKCPTCGKLFADKSNLAKHVKIHADEKLFHCPACGQIFAHKSHVTIHVRIHDGEKPLRCFYTVKPL